MMRTDRYNIENITEDKLFKDSIIDKQWTLTILKKLNKPITSIIRSLDKELIEDIKLSHNKLNQQYTLADSILECRDSNNVKVIVHIEIQRTKDKTMRARMETYSKGIQKLYPGIDIYQIFIYTGRTKLKANERLSGFVDISTLELRQSFTVKEMFQSFSDTSGRAFAIYCATSENDFAYLQESFLDELYKKYDNELTRDDSYRYLYKILCILYLEGKTSRGGRSKLVEACKNNIEKKFKRYSNKDTDDIMKVIKDPYIARLKKSVMEEGMQKGIQLGSLNVLSKMIKNKQLERKQSEEYLRELGMDDEAIIKFLKDTMDQ